MFKKIEKILRSNYFLYLIFIWIYKKFNFIFFIIEKKQFEFLYKIKQNFINYVILNIGSNYNQNCRIILKINKNFKILNFEPNNLRFQNNEFKEYANVKNLNFGALNENISKKLYTPYYKGYALDSLASLSKKNIKSYLKENNLDASKVIFKSKICKFVKLDKYFYKTFFLKIDTEGSEIKVLKGLKKTIKKYNPIILLESNGYKDDNNLSQLKIIEKFLKIYKYKKFTYQNNRFVPYEKNLKKRDIFFLSQLSFKYISN